MKHRRLAFALNAVLILISAWALFHGVAAVSGRTPGFEIHSLRRHGVISIDDEKARQMNPAFDGTYRSTEMGFYVARHNVFDQTLSGACGLTVGLLNVLVFLRTSR